MKLRRRFKVLDTFYNLTLSLTCVQSSPGGSSHYLKVLILESVRTAAFHLTDLDNSILGFLSYYCYFIDYVASERNG